MNDQAETEVDEQSGGDAQHVLVVVALVLLVIDLYLLVGVVPNFKTMFDALKGELPAVSQWVLHFSWLAQTWLLPLLLVLAAGGWMAYRHAARIPLILPVGLVLILIGLMLIVPVAIFYPIMQLQAAVRGEAPTPGQSPDAKAGSGVQ